MKEQESHVSRRDFLKITAGFSGFLALPQRLRQLEQPYSIEWAQSYSPKIDAYYHQSRYPTQTWGYQFYLGNDNYLYSLAQSALIAKSRLEPNDLLLVVDLPNPEMYKLEIGSRPPEFVEDTRGRMIQSYLDSRFIENAIPHFSYASQIELLLSIYTSIHRDRAHYQSIPRYLECEEISENTRVLPGPLALINSNEEYDSETTHLAGFSSQNESRLLFSYAARVTLRDGSWAYFTPILTEREQLLTG